MTPAIFSALSVLRPAFSRQRSFVLVSALLVAMLFCGKYTTLTTEYLLLGQLLPGVVNRYWSLPALLRRRQWKCEDLIVLFLQLVIGTVGSGILVADASSTTTQGKRQQGRHFRPNNRYRKGEQNQSKFLAGNSVLTLAWVATEDLYSGVANWCVGLGSVLLVPSSKRMSEREVLRRTICRLAPKGTSVVYDRAGNDASTINRFKRAGLRYITRLNANAVVYEDPACRRKIDTSSYQRIAERNGRNCYRSEHICYRHRVNGELKVVIDIQYNPSRRKWVRHYYLSTDLSLSAEEIVGIYQKRCLIENVHADSKLLNGFNSCRLHSKASIEAYLCLAMIATGILELLRYSLRHPAADQPAVTTAEILEHTGMHWYKPLRLTRGLATRYLEQMLRSDPKSLHSFGAAFSQHIAARPDRSMN